MKFVESHRTITVSINQNTEFWLPIILDPGKDAKALDSTEPQWLSPGGYQAFEFCPLVARDPGIDSGGLVS